MRTHQHYETVRENIFNFPAGHYIAVDTWRTRIQYSHAWFKFLNKLQGLLTVIPIGTTVNNPDFMPGIFQNSCRITEPYRIINGTTLSNCRTPGCPRKAAVFSFERGIKTEYFHRFILLFYTRRPLSFHAMP